MVNKADPSFLTALGTGTLEFPLHVKDIQSSGVTYSHVRWKIMELSGNRSERYVGLVYCL